jgi:hypothetical protein
MAGMDGRAGELQGGQAGQRRCGQRRTTASNPELCHAGMRLGSDGTNYLNGHLATINYYDTFSGQIYTRRKNKAVFSLL